MALPRAKFEKFFNEPFLLATGKANFTISLETAIAIAVSLVIGYQVWGLLAFPIVVPLTNIDLGVLVPLVIAFIPFTGFKLFTAKRSFMEVLEDIGSFFVPSILPTKEDDLVPPYMMDEE